MTYILEKILTVREHRENKSLNHLVQSKEQVKQAVAVKHQKEKELYDFNQWRQLEEQHLFENLKSEPANVHDVMYYADTIQTLRRDQAEKAQIVQDASDQVVAAEQALETARQHYAQACRKKMKITEHKNIWMEEHNLLIEQKAENDLEEIIQIKGSKSLYNQ